jgi:SM-20-related protein
MTAFTFQIRQSAKAEHSAAAHYAANGHVRLHAAFAEREAAALHRHLDTELKWSRVVNQGEKTWDLGPASIEAMAGGQDAPLIDAVNRGAREGFQYIYDSVRVSDDSQERRDRGLLVDSLIEALNAQVNLERLRRITGAPDIVRVDGQATRYLPGHFLTGHDDDVEGKGRVAAYVVNLTPRWRTEWGGLLLFHDQNGDVIRGLRPGFNAINLFSVPQVHSVSQVTAFAGAPRLSVTGWLRRW